MSLVRLTPELYEKLKNSMGLSAQQIRDGINTGQFEGKKAAPDSRIYLIDDKYIPKEESEKVAPEVVTDESKTLGKSADVLKAEALKIKAEMELQVVKNERDKPEVLKKKEEELNTLQVELSILKKTLDEQKSSLDLLQLKLNGEEQRLKTLSEAIEQTRKDTENGLKLLKDSTKTELEELKQSIEKAIEEILTEYDTEMIGRQTELEKVERQIKQKEQLILQHNQAIEQYKVDIVPYVENLNEAINATQLYADYHNKMIGKTSGQREQYHVNMQNGFQVLKQKFEKLLKGLGL